MRLFVLLSVADLTLTCWLIGRSDGRVIEANPVARWWLDTGGWIGLAGFKVAIVTLVLTLAAFLARVRPRAANRVLGFGCVAVGLVVLHGLWLSPLALQSAEDRKAAIARECRAYQEVLNQGTVETHTQSLAYWRMRDALVEDLVAERLTLCDAACKLATTKRAHDPCWRCLLETAYGDRSLEECLADQLLVVIDVEAARDGTAYSATVKPRLVREYEAAYGEPPLLVSPASVAVHALARR